MNPTEWRPQKTQCRGGASIRSDDDLVASVNAAPAHTTFCIAAGTYSVSEIIPKAGDRFIGVPGAILDGGNTVERAIANYAHADDVVVRGITFRHFVGSSPEDGAIGAFSGHNWLVEDNAIVNNLASGISVGKSVGLVIRDNLIASNGCGGIMGTPSVDLTVDSNEIASNNTGGYDGEKWSCGGAKLGEANGVDVTNNYIHDNNGYGFWPDSRDVNMLFADNRFVDNADGGILIEIDDAHAGGANADVVGNLDGTGYSVRILGNTFTGNGGAAHNRIMFGAAIVVAASNHVEIADNRIDATNAHAITVNYTPRHDFSSQDLTVHDISVHDNDIALRTDGSDPLHDVGRVGFYTNELGAAIPHAVSFRANSYYFDDSGAFHFSLPGTTDHVMLATWSMWRDLGFDGGSQVLPAAQFPAGGANGDPAPAALRTETA